MTPRRGAVHRARWRVAVLVAAVLLAPAYGSSAAVAGEEEPGGGVTATDAPCETAADDTENVVRARSDSAPLEEMQIDEVHRRFSTGDGVGVAVIDSGIATTDAYLPDVRLGEPQVTPPADVQEIPGRPTVAHGTIVAGLIAGRRDEGDVIDEEGLGMGVAPDADLYSIRIVDTLDESGDASVLPEEQFAPGDLVAGLEWVADEARRLGIRVLNLSLTAADTPELERAVRRVQRAGVIVVAATGNRDPEADPLPEGDYEPLPDDEDRYPAAYDGVVGVGALVPREALAQQFVLSSGVVDVAASTVGAVSTVPTGSSCLLETPATSWSTAYVSGVLALLVDVYGEEESNEEIVDRLVETASGVPGARSRFTGAGVVQPLEAMTRDLPRGAAEDDADRGGGDDSAPAPPVATDELAASRDDFRWWGLLAGAALVAAVILRPLFRRLRRG